MTAVFHHLSILLCAERDLPVSLANDYFHLLTPDPSFKNLLDKYKSIVDCNPANITEEIKKQLVTDPEFRKLIKKILRLWYFGRSEEMKVQKGAKHFYHYDALIWKVLHAHPPGLTGGYFGYWAYKPES